MELGDLGAHLHAQLGVEVGERFVEEEGLRFAHDGAADGDALALAAGERLGLALSSSSSVMPRIWAASRTRWSISAFGYLRSIRPNAMFS